MTDEEFKTWDRHTAENLITQRDDALARIEKRGAEADGVVKAHQDEVKKLTDAHADELNRRDDEAKALAEKHVAELAERNRVIADTEEQGRLDVIAEAEPLKQEISGLKNRLANLQGNFDSLKAAHDQALQVMSVVQHRVTEALPAAEALFSDFIKRARDAVPQLHQLASDVTDAVTGSSLVKQRRRQELEATKAAADAELAKLDADK